MTASDIIREVAASHGITVAQVMGKSIERNLVAARTEIARRLEAERDLSHGQIARLVGRSKKAIKIYLRPDYRARRITRQNARSRLLREQTSGMPA
jgi:predicted transcriptional regulator